MNTIQTILVFLSVQILYVILNTLKAIWQIKGGRLLASFSSGLCYFVYTFVLVLTANASEMSTILKAILVFITNFVGVYLSLFILDKIKKDQLWEIVATITKGNYEELRQTLKQNNISYNRIVATNGDEIFHIYSKNKKESQIVKEKLIELKAHYIVHTNNITL